MRMLLTSLLLNLFIIHAHHAFASKEARDPSPLHQPKEEADPSNSEENAIEDGASKPKIIKYC